MKYNIYLISLFIILLALPASADERYRVEILVLKHLDHSEQAREVQTISDYSSALDFLLPEPEEDPGEGEPLCEAKPGAEEDPPATADEPAEGTGQNDPLGEESAEIEEDLPDPNAVVHVAEMGPEMQEAWRRLRLSGPFRPLQFLSWEQGSQEPFPSLRIHDQAIVMTDDPWVDLRGAEDEFAAVYGDSLPLPPEGEEVDPCAEPEVDPDPLPDPTLYYALDGTVSLVRTRFLHLHLDLQLREAAPEPVPNVRGGPVPAMIPGGADPAEITGSRPDAFLTHDLQQNRQVRSGRMEYFDGPVIGVLAWITSLPLEEPAER